MTAFKAIREALLPITTKYKWPLEPNMYDGTENYYITYNYADDRGGDFGDDSPLCNVADIQVHFFMPQKDKAKKLNFIPYKEEIRRALYQNDFTYPVVRTISNTDTDRQMDVWHIVFECEYVETI